MDEILSDIDQKLNKSDLKESDKGYSTYLNMREGKTDNENEILKIFGKAVYITLS